jgi:hypothetical protein
MGYFVFTVPDDFCYGILHLVFIGADDFIDPWTGVF